MGEMYSAGFPLRYPMNSERNDEETGLNKWAYLVWVPGYVGKLRIPYPHTISLPKKSLLEKVSTKYGHPVTLNDLNCNSKGYEKTTLLLVC